MICKQCGAEYPDGGKFCPSCGTPNQAQKAQPAPGPQTYQPARPYQPVPAAPSNDPGSFLAAHPEYRPMSAWSYFGHSLLYSIPIVGFIFLIIHSCKSNYIARRNYARSFWCALIVAAAVFAVCALIALAFGQSIFQAVEQLPYVME